MISRTRTISLNAPLQVVFPLFGPVEEKKWAHGWDPMEINPEGAVFELGMHFKTRSDHTHEDYYQWKLTHLSWKRAEVRYTVRTMNRLWYIDILCMVSGKNSTSATISYTYEALNDQGEQMNRSALLEMFKENLNDWETAINHYLETGDCLQANTTD